MYLYHATSILPPPPIFRMTPSSRETFSFSLSPVSLFTWVENPFPFLENTILILYGGAWKNVKQKASFSKILTKHCENFPKLKFLKMHRLVRLTLNKPGIWFPRIFPPSRKSDSGIFLFSQTKNVKRQSRFTRIYFKRGFSWGLHHSTPRE